MEIGGEFWTGHPLFRDFLRAHPDVARRYDVLKRQLAARLGADRDAYTEAKMEFVREIEERARAGSTPHREDRV